MKRVYVGGALFSEAEIAQRKKEAAALRKISTLEVYNPIEASINNKSDLPRAHDIFWCDTAYILESDYILAELNNKIDEGLVAELAIAWTWNWVRKNLETKLKTNSKESLYLEIEKMLEAFPKKEIVAHASDIRINTANMYEGINIPVGYNQYVIGMIQDQDEIIFGSAEAAIQYIKDMEWDNNED